MKIAFVTIATNKYISYAENLLDTLNQYAFLKDNVKFDFFVFSNIPQIFNNKNGRIKTTGVNITHVPFPLISLLRYHYYSSCYELENYDFIFHIDCDMLLKDDIRTDILAERVCVRHPGMASFQTKNYYPYDRVAGSNACVFENEGNEYYQNCFQGGSGTEFLKMSKELRGKIEQDLRKNYIALWHDESYMNRYMIDNPPTLVLPETYAQPESWPSFGSTKILHVDKNHLEVRKID